MILAGKNVWEAQEQKQRGRSWVGAQGAGPLEAAVEGCIHGQVQERGAYVVRSRRGVHM